MFTLTFTTYNDEFADDKNGAVAIILRAIAARIAEGSAEHGRFITVFDVNGNDIGRYKLD